VGEAEDPPKGATPAWRRRLAAVPRGVWALVVAPVIPIIAATLMTSWLDDDDPPAPTSSVTATATSASTWDLAGAEYTEQMTLGDFLEGDTAAARERLGKLLGCEGWVFTVRLDIAGAGDARPQLRWTLRQDQGLERPWAVPPALETIRTMPVDPSTSQRRVWIAAPPQRETWRVQFALYASPANVPDAAKDTLTVKERVDSIPLPPGEGVGVCELDGAA
jgi:hypothetical protein